jgi:hypothetical protein
LPVNAEGFRVTEVFFCAILSLLLFYHTN